MHQRTHIADGPNVNLRAGKERHGTTEINRKAALDPAKDHAINALTLGRHFLKPRPGFFTLGLVAAEHSFAQGIFDALKINFNRIARLDGGFLARLGKFLEGHPAFSLQTNVNDDEVILDREDLALDHRAFGDGTVEIALFEQGHEVVNGRGHGNGGFRHGL